MTAATGKEMNDPSGPRKRRNARRLAAIVIAGLIVGGARRGFAAAGAEPFQFLLLDANARSVGMGGAYSAIAADSNALLYNPAGLGMVNRHEATFMHNAYFEGAAQEYAAVALRQGFGLSLNYLGYGSISRTTYSNPNGTLGSFGINDMAISAGYGHDMSSMIDGLSLGGGIKYIRESIDNFSAGTAAFDFGALYMLRQIKGLSLAAALQNLGPTVRFQSDTQNLPIDSRIGGAYMFDYRQFHNTVALDLSKARTDPVVVGIGVESVFNKIAAGRLGFNSRNDAGIGITGGVGYVSPNFNVDYAIVPYGDLGLTHRISITYRWGEAATNKQAEKRGVPRTIQASDGLILKSSGPS